MQYTLVRNEEGEENLTVYRTGEKPLTVHSSNTRFEEIKAGVLAGDENVYDLFDLAVTIGKRFLRLTDRIAVKGGVMYLDGDPIHDALADQVCRFIEEGVEDWRPLVLFYENLAQNPNQHSREQLFPWIQEQQISITPDGLMIGYKGVNHSKDDKSILVSGYAGKAIVDGEQVEGYIPNAVGSVVEMPRSEVMHRPSADCDAGLHVGSFEYAKGYGEVTLEVHVNPRDVVSVPNAGWKLRTCRYKVIQEIDRPHTKVVVASRPKKAKKPTVAKIIKEAVKPVTVSRGNVFEDADKRRAGTYIRVQRVDGDRAYGVRIPSGKKVEVQISRLASRKYRKLSKADAQKVTAEAKVAA